MNGRGLVVALVPARGGSKSVPRKNLVPLAGRPLLAWPIAVALDTAQIDRVIVSTDDAEIAATARTHGAEVHDRPPELATDEALVVDTIRTVRDWLAAAGTPAAVMVLLEATSPFRTAELVGRCVDRLFDEQLDSIATFHTAAINPERVWRIEEGAPRPFIDGTVPWRPRQALTPAYQLNGLVYAFRPDRLPPDSPGLLFGRIGAEIVPADAVVDIDEHKDFVIAESLLRA